MTDSDSTSYSDGGAASTSESKPNWRRDLENRVKDAEERASSAEDRLSSYERRDTFQSAGLDLSDARVKYFVKGYEGELDAEAIRQEAMAAGFLGDNAPPVQAEAMMQDAMQAEQRIQAVGEGGDPVSQADLEARIKATTNQDELRALMEGEGILWGATA
jgi:ribosomal protein L12E/L44/L45/RPP1/RPP2